MWRANTRIVVGFRKHPLDRTEALSRGVVDQTPKSGTYRIAHHDGWQGHGHWRHGLCRQAIRIAERQRIATRIVEPIPPSRQSDRIRLRVPPGLRVVRPEAVVVQFRLLVEVLAGIAQVELEVALGGWHHGEVLVGHMRGLVAEGRERPLP